jgi:antitoxin YefM
MNIVSLEQAKNELELVIAHVLADAEPTIVSTPAGESVVLMPLGDFESWQETAYLLRSPANAARLRKSIAEAESGKMAVRELVD